MNGKELKKIIDNSGIKALDLIDKSGIPQKTFYRLFDKDEIEKHFLLKLQLAGLNVSNNATEGKPVPYYDIDATAGNVAIFNEDRSEYIKQYISVPAFADCDMFINISGNSMYPKYCSGELIAIKKIEDREVISFGEAYLIITKEQRLLKYVHKGKDIDHWVLKSENKEFDSFDINHKNKVLHVYIVKGKITKNIL
ncbi:MAG: Peptidase S24-like protein [Firmicutes bacterium ADurb.Bin419]|nr:MAG: Peptidase S24-like protein [Firmicutes bacterium ADurb.Bin419]